MKTPFFLMMIVSLLLVPGRSFADHTPTCGGSGTAPDPNATMVETGITGVNSIYCLGDSLSANLIFTNTSGQLVTTTTNASDCSISTSSNSCDITLVTNYYWNVSAGSVSTNGTNSLGAGAVLTSPGAGTVTFSHLNSSNACDGTPCSFSDATASFGVEAVTSLTPDHGQKVDDGDGDANTDTYLVQYGCNPTITIAAVDALGLAASALPSCWQSSVTHGTATKIDNKTYSVDGNTIGKTTINMTCGTSSNIITLIVYQAKVELDADEGSRSILNVGHAWWNLSVQPSDAYQFLQGYDPDTGNPVDLSLSGPQGLAGYYPNGGLLFPSSPGEIIYGPQPDVKNGGTHTATGSYWWCISFGCYVNALEYVYGLKKHPGNYTVKSNNCTKKAEYVGDTACAPISFFGYKPWDFSDYLNSLSKPAACSCN